MCCHAWQGNSFVVTYNSTVSFTAQDFLFCTQVGAYAACHADERQFGSHEPSFVFVAYIVVAIVAVGIAFYIIKKW